MPIFRNVVAISTLRKAEVAMMYLEIRFFLETSLYYIFLFLLIYVTVISQTIFV